MNFLGCLFWAGLLSYASDALKDAGQVDLAIKVAEKKVHQAWIHIFLKGIGANFMVCQSFRNIAWIRSLLVTVDCSSLNELVCLFLYFENTTTRK